MRLKTATDEAFQLIHEGTIALSQVEHNGIRVDMDYIQKKKKEVDEQVKEYENAIKQDPLWDRWKTVARRMGKDRDLGSRDQLAELVFVDQGHPIKEWTEGGEGKKKRPKADQAAFQWVDLDLTRNYIKMMQSQHSKDILVGIEKSTSPMKRKNGRTDWFMRTNYNMNIARSYRSTADGPNFQNFPIRDKFMGKFVRSAFIPREDYIFLEADLKGAEVRAGYCYHKDPMMKKYLLDETTDMHRDMASQCYMVPPEQVTKDARYCGKNMWVFPQFYGDYYVNCAKNMWEACLLRDLKTNRGTPILEVLKSKGITEMGACDPQEKPRKGTFEYHLKTVQEDFWGSRFKVYNKWKDSWYNEYLETGGFMMYSGFWVEGLYSKNDVTNYPVQGFAFHWELWSLIQLQKWLNKNKMRSKIVGQIHDSILIDCHKDELQDVIAKIHQIMTVDLLKHWRQIIIPVEIEIETSSTNWHEKKEYKLAI